MPTAPTFGEVSSYLGPDSGFDDGAIAEALTAEIAAQSRVVRFPADPALPADPLPYPDDLREALFRRVAHNLALRRLPLGVQATLSDTAVATNHVGGTDAEVARLERPHRKRVVA